MTQSICIACLGSGPLFDNKSIDELEQERNFDYWSIKTPVKFERLW